VTGQADLKGGGHLAYAVRGEGPALLLVRPVGGSMVSWHRFAALLEEKARVISFDARGTGQSSAAPLNTTTRTMAADARALLDHLGIDRAHVFGLSLGGMVATWLALDSPAGVDRLVLASTMPKGLEVRAGAVFRGLSIARALVRAPAEAEAHRHPDSLAQVPARAPGGSRSRAGARAALPRFAPRPADDARCRREA